MMLSPFLRLIHIDPIIHPLLYPVPSWSSHPLMRKVLASTKALEHPSDSQDFQRAETREVHWRLVPARSPAHYLSERVFETNRVHQQFGPKKSGLQKFLHLLGVWFMANCKMQQYAAICVGGLECFLDGLGISNSTSACYYLLAAASQEIQSKINSESTCISSQCSIRWWLPLIVIICLAWKSHNYPEVPLWKSQAARNTASTEATATIALGQETACCLFFLKGKR